MIDFIGIGTTKSGTTTISYLLDAHPDICFSIPKEVRFFNSYKGVAEKYTNPNFSESPEWYHRHWQHCNAQQIKGEYTPVYFTHPEAPPKIKQYRSDIKLILSFRDPAKRLFSHYLMNRHAGVDGFNHPFEDFLAEMSHPIFKVGQYAHYLKQWYEHFPSEQIHIVILEDLKSNPAQSIQNLYRFLGVNSEFVPDEPGRVHNSAKAVTNPKLKHQVRSFANWLIDHNLGSVVKFVMDSKIKSGITKSYMKPIEKPQFKEEWRRQLVSYYNDDVEELEQILGHDLSTWKT